MFNKKKAETPPTPTPVFDLVAAERALLSQFEIKLTTTGALVYKVGGKFVPITTEIISRFLRSHLIEIDQTRFFRRDLADDFAAFVKAGL